MDFFYTFTYILIGCKNRKRKKGSLKIIRQPTINLTLTTESLNTLSILTF